MAFSCSHYLGFDIQITGLDEHFTEAVFKLFQASDIHGKLTSFHWNPLILCLWLNAVYALQKIPLLQGSFIHLVVVFNCNNLIYIR